MTNKDKKELYEKIMKAIVPEVKKTLNEVNWQDWLHNNPSGYDHHDPDNNSMEELHTELMDAVNGRVIDFVKADGEGVTLDTVEDGKNLVVNVIYPDGMADTNVGKVELYDVIADEDDMYTLIDLVNDYSEVSIEKDDDKIVEFLTEDDADGDEFDDINDTTPTDILQVEVVDYGTCTARCCYDTNSSCSFWDITDEDGNHLCEIWDDTTDPENLADLISAEMDGNNNWEEYEYQDPEESADTPDVSDEMFIDALKAYGELEEDDLDIIMDGEPLFIKGKIVKTLYIGHSDTLFFSFYDSKRKYDLENEISVGQIGDEETIYKIYDYIKNN